MLRCELSSWKFTRSWCYVVNFPLGGVWGGFGGGCDNVLSLAFLLTSFCWCYVVNFLLGSLHGLDATLWTFFSEFCTLLMLRCELSSQSFTRSWCYVMNFLLRVLHALDATLWTFFSELYTLLMLCCELSSWKFYTLLMLRCELSSWKFCTLLMLRCELSSWKFCTLLMLRCELSSQGFTRFWCYVMNFLLRVLHALDAMLWTFFSEFYTFLMLRYELSSQSFARSWCYVVNFRQSVLPLNPQGFMSQLRRLLKSNWAPMEKWKERTDGPHWPYIPNMV